MKNLSLMDQIMERLAFEVKAIPQENKRQNISTTNFTPLNIKIRIRDRDHNQFLRHGIISIPKTDHTYSTEKIHRSSSDQTIISFNVLMEQDESMKKPQRKQRRIFHLFKKGGCLGIQTDEDDFEYSKSISRKGNTGDKLFQPMLSTSKNAIDKRNFTLTKNYGSLEASRTVKRTHKDLLGKCKPGGCLDPPFSEDKYSYVPTFIKIPDSVQRIVQVKEVTETSFTKNQNLKANDGISCISDSKTEQLSCATNLSLLKIKSSNSIMTYPSITTSDNNADFQKKLKSNKSSKDNRFSNLSHESIKTYYIAPKRIKIKKTQEITENISGLNTQTSSSETPSLGVYKNMNDITLKATKNNDSLMNIETNLLDETLTMNDTNNEHFNSHLDNLKNSNKIMLNLTNKEFESKYSLNNTTRSGNDSVISFSDTTFRKNVIPKENYNTIEKSPEPTNDPNIVSYLENYDEAMKFDGSEKNEGENKLASLKIVDLQITDFDKNVKKLSAIKVHESEDSYKTELLKPYQVNICQESNMLNELNYLKTVDLNQAKKSFIENNNNLGKIANQDRNSEIILNEKYSNQLINISKDSKTDLSNTAIYTNNVQNKNYNKDLQNVYDAQFNDKILGSNNNNTETQSPLQQYSSSHHPQIIERNNTTDLLKNAESHKKINLANKSNHGEPHNHTNLTTMETTKEIRNKVEDLNKYGLKTSPEFDAEKYLVNILKLNETNTINSESGLTFMKTNEEPKINFEDSNTNNEMPNLINKLDYIESHTNSTLMEYTEEIESPNNSPINKLKYNQIKTISLKSDLTFMECTEETKHQLKASIMSNQNISPDGNFENVTINKLKYEQINTINLKPDEENKIEENAVYLGNRIENVSLFRQSNEENIGKLNNLRNELPSEFQNNYKNQIDLNTAVNQDFQTSPSGINSEEENKTDARIKTHLLQLFTKSNLMLATSDVNSMIVGNDSTMENIIKSQNNRYREPSNSEFSLKNSFERPEPGANNMSIINNITKSSHILRKNSTDKTVYKEMQETKLIAPSKSLEQSINKELILNHTLELQEKSVTKVTDDFIISKDEKDIIHLSMAYQSFYKGNEVVIRTLDTSRLSQIKRYPNDNILQFETVIRADGSHIKIPLGLDKDLSLQITKVEKTHKEYMANELSALSKQHSKQKSVLFDKDKNNGRLFANSQSDKKDFNINMKGYIQDKTKSEGNLQQTLDTVYKEKLLPLHTTIKKLKSDIDELLKQQFLVKVGVNREKGFQPHRIPNAGKSCCCTELLN